MSKLTLTRSEYGKRAIVKKNVSFQIKGAGQFELVSQDGKLLQTLTLSMKGSDGMSDTIYPYEVKAEGMDSMANGGYGGCYSNHLQTKAGEP